jgi:molybdopterin-containing oxidoreductase family iron-sulfur binding subunit
MECTSNGTLENGNAGNNGNAPEFGVTVKPETRNPKRETKPLDLASIRTRLATLRGVEYWRGLEELAETEEFKAFLHQEFPRHASVWMDSLDRRSFLKFMGASLALAGLGGCVSPAPAPPDEKIVPYVNQPEEIIPGKPLFFATAMPLGGFGRGVLVESHMGRPTKIEGNPEHPASLGSSDVFMQASALEFYDPDRSHVLSNAGMISTWNRFFSALNAELETQRLTQGAGLRILTETITSPTLTYQLNQLLKQFPRAKWHQYEPVGRGHVYEGSRLAFGEAVETLYRLDKAEVILSLDSDFLYFGPGSIRYARDFANKRRVSEPKAEMNRLYVVESTPSVTGSMADHRLPLGPIDIEGFARIVAKGLGVELPGEAPAVPARYDKWTRALIRDLQKHRGSSLVLAGDPQPPVVHALAHAMNQALGNVGNTVTYTEPVETKPINPIDSLRELVGDMEANAVQVLIMIGGNPVYTVPADIDFGSLLVKSNFSVHLSLYDDETSALCHWHIPEAHYLESWSDVRAFDGTASIIQPLIAPLYEGRTAHEILATLMGQPGRTSYEIVREYWKQQHPSPDFETFWRTAVHDGILHGTGAPAKQVSLKRDLSSWVTGASKTNKSDLEILFRPDPTIYDGRFANNGWLQELPKPLTKLTWDNAVLVSPATAERLGLTYRVGTTGGEHGTIYGDVVEIEYQGRKVRGAAWILPGHADDCVTLHLGYGRTRAGRVGTKTGFNANSLRTSDAFWHGSGLQIRRTGEQQPLACTQFHHLMEGRHLLRAGTLEEYRKNPNFVQESEEEEKPHGSLYPGFKYDGYAWGMAIDINSCIGCNACVVACVAENNSPVVGKKEVLRGREMHWIRVDRYYKGGLENPQMVHQPVPCMQCENAPCELVCPVGATNHSEEGLNDMVYNRCVGTRYCSNNCPYKVRRFNFFLYSDFQTPSLKPLRNPDVTVRSRGVMEKCTYCVQRINQAKITAERENRKVGDGEIVTACQQACPTQAIVFGDINDPDSRVSKLKAESLNYGLLTELNTKPRTTYQAKLSNPNPEIEDA